MNQPASPAPSNQSKRITIALIVIGLILLAAIAARLLIGSASLGLAHR